MKNMYILKVFTAFVIFLLACQKIQAQRASTYSFSSISSTYTYLSGGTSLSAVEGDDVVSGTVPIGFTFRYCGTDYTHLVACSNGWLSFNSALTSTEYANTLSELRTIKPALFPLWDNLSGHGTGRVSYKTSGSAPSREFIIEFRDWLWDYEAVNPIISFQVKLFEGTNVIQFRYKREPGAPDDASASIGIADNEATPTYLSLSNASASPTASYSVFTTGISAKPSDGRVYQFTPPPPCRTPAPGATTASATSICLGQTVMLSLASIPTTYGNTYQWQSSADGVSYTNISGATDTIYWATPTVPSYYKCVVTCSIGPSSAASSPIFVNFAHPAPSGVPATRCGKGTVNLGATASSGTLKWYNAAIGGVLSGTGSSFTTPVISNTTTYYVGAENNFSDTLAIGNGSSTTVSSGFSVDYISPFDHYYGGKKSQYLLRASELTAMGLIAGDITAAAFDVVSGGVLYKGFTMSIGTTSATALSRSSFERGLTTVYTTTAPAGFTTPASGLSTITFTTPFNWDGTSNLVIETCWSNNNYGGTGTTVRYDATSFSSYNYYRSDARTPDFICGSTASRAGRFRPKIILTGNKFCSSPRTPVTATVNALPVTTISPFPGPINICAGDSTRLTGGGVGNYQWRNATGHIPGATRSTYTTGSSEDYQLIVTNPTTGCKDSSAIVKVIVNPIPTVSVLPADTTIICADSALKYTSVTTGGPLTYKWYNAGVEIPGATADNYIPTSPGLYTLHVFRFSCSDTSNEVVMKMNPLPASSFSKTGPADIICIGSTLELTALGIPPTSKYQWILDDMDIPGATSQKYNASTGGIYKVRITDINNCRKNSDPLTILNTPMGNPDLSPTSATFCEGTIIKLYANAGPYASSYKWIKDGSPLPDTTAEINAAVAGYYTVTATDIYGCKASSGITTITVEPLPVKPVIARVANTLMVPPIYTSYQWYRNNKQIAGATKRTYTITFDGKYYVVVSSVSDCINVSDTLTIENLSVKNMGTQNINIYPNPVQHLVYIDAPLRVNLTVRNIQGKLISEVKDAVQVDMSSYADGVYMFTLMDQEGQVLGIQKIVKRTE